MLRRFRLEGVVSHAHENEQALARASLSRTLELMPRMLEGLV